MRKVVAIVAVICSLALGAVHCSALSMTNGDLRVTLSDTGAPLHAADRFQARPKLAAYAHIALPRSDRVPPATVEDIVRQTRESYEGPLVAAEEKSFSSRRRRRSAIDFSSARLAETSERG